MHHLNLELSTRPRSDPLSLWQFETYNKPLSYDNENVQDLMVGASPSSLANPKP